MPLLMKDLREFIQLLEQCGQLRRVSHPVSPHLEMTEICASCGSENIKTEMEVA